MLWSRIISAIIGVPIILGLIYLGGFYFLFGVIILSLLAMIELSRMLLRMGRESMPSFLLAGAILFPILLYYQPSWLPSFTTLFIISGAIISLSKYPDISFQDLGANFLGVLYISFGFAHLVLLRGLEQGMLLVIYGFIIIWITDSGAYFIGRAFGKRPFFQKISPKKTWEGAIGGLLFGVISAFVFCYITEKFTPLNNKVFLLWLAPILSCAGQLGDLFESALKRKSRVKDSSRIIPGHGGILDRFDSALWVMPLLFHCLKLYEMIIL